MSTRQKAQIIDLLDFAEEITHTKPATDPTHKPVIDRFEERLAANNNCTSIQTSPVTVYNLIYFVYPNFILFYSFLYYDAKYILILVFKIQTTRNKQQDKQEHCH